MLWSSWVKWHDDHPPPAKAGEEKEYHGGPRLRPPDLVLQRGQTEAGFCDLLALVDSTLPLRNGAPRQQLGETMEWPMGTVR